MVRACFVVALAFLASSSASALEPATGPEAAAATVEDFILDATPHSVGEAFSPGEVARLGLAGRVSFVYSVNTEGRATGITLLEADSSGLAANARAVLVGYRFVVPADWTGSGGPLRRFRVGFIYKLPGKPVPLPLEDKRPTIALTVVK